jgi:hypothetical protein
LEPLCRRLPNHLAPALSTMIKCQSWEANHPYSGDGF